MTNLEPNAAHDFLARVISWLIRQIKPLLFRRTQPFVAPGILTLSLAFLGHFIPGWQADAGQLQRNAEQRALEGISLTANKVWRSIR